MNAALGTLVPARPPIEAAAAWLRHDPTSSGWAEYLRLVRAGVHYPVAASLVLEQLARRPRRSGHRLPREHGTERGWRQHRHDGTTACRRCAAAHSRHNVDARGARAAA